MELVEENDRQQPDKPTSPSNSPNDYSEFVPIFYENDYLNTYDKSDLPQFTAAYYPFTSGLSRNRRFPSKIPFTQTGRIMADRFPSIDDLDLGKN